MYVLIYDFLITVIYLFIRRTRWSTLFPYTTLFRSSASRSRAPGTSSHEASPRRTRSWSAASSRSGTSRRQSATSGGTRDRKSTRLNSSHANISYAVFCLKKKNKTHYHIDYQTTSQP